MLKKRANEQSKRSNDQTIKRSNYQSQQRNNKLANFLVYMYFCVITLMFTRLLYNNRQAKRAAQTVQAESEQKLAKQQAAHNEQRSDL